MENKNSSPCTQKSRRRQSTPYMTNSLHLFSTAGKTQQLFKIMQEVYCPNKVDIISVWLVDSPGSTWSPGRGQWAPHRRAGPGAPCCESGPSNRSPWMWNWAVALGSFRNQSILERPTPPWWKLALWASLQHIDYLPRHVSRLRQKINWEDYHH